MFISEGIWNVFQIVKRLHLLGQIVFVYPKLAEMNNYAAL